LWSKLSKTHGGVLRDINNVLVYITPGCYICTMDHVISADESETKEIHMKTKDWAGELMELFRRTNTGVIHLVIQGLRMKYKGEFDTYELFKRLDQTLITEAHWTFTPLAAMILIALAIFLVGALIWRKYHKTSEPMTTPNADVDPQLWPINKATKSNASIPISFSFS
jgi:hypothetical protein